jgi:hypothetical protein
VSAPDIYELVTRWRANGVRRERSQAGIRHLREAGDELGSPGG